MSYDYDISVTETPTRREDYGKGHRYFIDGQRVPGCTTILNNGFPKQLAKWGSEQTAAKAVNNWARLGRLPVAQRLKELEKAPWEDISRAGIKGTRVHKYAELLSSGGKIAVPADIAGHVKAAMRFMAEWKPEPILVEAPVFSRKHQYGATLDLMARLADGNVWLIDWKTNRSGPFGDVAYQLAASRYADFMLDNEGNEIPVPDVNMCGVVWLCEDGTYQLYPYEVTRHVYREFLAIAQVADAVDNSKYYRGDPLSSPVEITP